MYRPLDDVPRSSSPRRTSTPLRFRTATLLPSGDIIGTINVDAIIHRVAPFLPLSQVFPSFEDASLFEILLFESKEESRGGEEKLNSRRKNTTVAVVLERREEERNYKRSYVVRLRERDETIRDIARYSGSIPVDERVTSKSLPSICISISIDHETEVSVIHGPVSSQRRRVTREILSSHSARKYRMQMRRRV